MCNIRQDVDKVAVYTFHIFTIAESGVDTVAALYVVSFTLEGLEFIWRASGVPNVSRGLQRKVYINVLPYGHLCSL